MKLDRHDWKKFQAKSRVSHLMGYTADIVEDVSRENLPRENIYAIALTDDGRGSIQKMLENAILEEQWTQAAKAYRNGEKPNQEEIKSPVSWQEALYEVIKMRPLQYGFIKEHFPNEYGDYPTLPEPPEQIKIISTEEALELNLDGSTSSLIEPGQYHVLIHVKAVDINALRERLRQLEERMTDLEEQLQQAIDDLQRQINELKERVDNLEEIVDDLQRQINELKEIIDDLKRRIKSIEDSGGGGSGGDSGSGPQPPNNPDGSKQETHDYVVCQSIDPPFVVYFHRNGDVSSSLSGELLYTQKEDFKDITGAVHSVGYAYCAGFDPRWMIAIEAELNAVFVKNISVELPDYKTPELSPINVWLFDRWNDDTPENEWRNHPFNRGNDEIEVGVGRSGEDEFNVSITVERTEWLKTQFFGNPADGMVQHRRLGIAWQGRTLTNWFAFLADKVAKAPGVSVAISKICYYPKHAGSVELPYSVNFTEFNSEGVDQANPDHRSDYWKGGIGGWSGHWGLYTFDNPSRNYIMMPVVIGGREPVQANRFKLTITYWTQYGVPIAAQLNDGDWCAEAHGDTNYYVTPIQKTETITFNSYNGHIGPKESSQLMLVITGGSPAVTSLTLSYEG